MLVMQILLHFQQKIFERIPGVRVVDELPDSETSWFGVPIVCENGPTSTDKHKLVEHLEKNGVQTRNYFACQLRGLQLSRLGSLPQFLASLGGFSCLCKYLCLFAGLVSKPCGANWNQGRNQAVCPSLLERRAAWNQVEPTLEPSRLLNVSGH